MLKSACATSLYPRALTCQHLDALGGQQRSVEVTQWLGIANLQNGASSKGVCHVCHPPKPRHAATARPVIEAFRRARQLPPASGDRIAANGRADRDPR